MKPRRTRETGQTAMFRSRLDKIIDPGHEPARLSKLIHWEFLEERLSKPYSVAHGCELLPIRLMAGLSILKSTIDLLDKDLTARWIENPYY